MQEKPTTLDFPKREREEREKIVLFAAMSYQKIFHYLVLFVMLKPGWLFLLVLFSSLQEEEKEENNITRLPEKNSCAKSGEFFSVRGGGGFPVKGKRRGAIGLSRRIFYNLRSPPLLLKSRKRLGFFSWFKNKSRLEKGISGSGRPKDIRCICGLRPKIMTSSVPGLKIPRSSFPECLGFSLFLLSRLWLGKEKFLGRSMILLFFPSKRRRKNRI